MTGIGSCDAPRGEAGGLQVLVPDGEVREGAHDQRGSGSPVCRPTKVGVLSRLISPVTGRDWATLLQRLTARSQLIILANYLVEAVVALEPHNLHM